MIMNCAQYTGKCVCGHEHTLETKMVVVEYNALANFEKYMEAVGLADKRRTVVYDTNVYRLTEGKHIPCDQEIVLDANGLRSEDILIEKMMKDLDKPEVIVAFGAGTIMDFGRYPAYKLGIPFVAVPTLASSDGFTANICSVILEGQKKSIPMCAPILVVADLDIIKGAPARLVASGINDILAERCGLTGIAGSGFFRFGSLPSPMTAQEYAAFLRERLHGEVRLMGPGSVIIRKVGLCSGGGSEEWPAAKENGCQAFVTGEIRHHIGLAMADSGIAGFECGHFCTEEPGIRSLASTLQKAVNTVECNVRIYVSGVSAYSFPRQP